MLPPVKSLSVISLTRLSPASDARRTELLNVPHHRLYHQQPEQVKTRSAFKTTRPKVNLTNVWLEARGLTSKKFVTISFFFFKSLI